MWGLSTGECVGPSLLVFNLALDCVSDRGSDRRDRRAGRPSQLASSSAVTPVNSTPRLLPSEASIVCSACITEMCDYDKG